MYASVENSKRSEIKSSMEKNELLHKAVKTNYY